MFSAFHKTYFRFSDTLPSANTFILDWCKDLSLGKVLTLSQTSPGFYVSADKSIENTVGKGEIAPFPTVFSSHLENFPSFPSDLKLSANSFNLEESKICCLGKC